MYASPNDGNPVQAAQSLISQNVADTATFDPSTGDPKVPITGTTSSAFYQMFRATDFVKNNDKNRSVFIDYYKLLGNPDANGIYTSKKEINIPAHRLFEPKIKANERNVEEATKLIANAKKPIFYINRHY